MGWFSVDRSYELVRMNEAIVQSFQKVKTDVGNLNDWIRFLYQQNNYQQDLLKSLTTELQARRLQPEQTKALIKTELRSELDNFENKIRQVMRREIFNSTASIRQGIKREVAAQLHHTHTSVFDKLRAMDSNLHAIATKVDAAAQEHAPSVQQNEQIKNQLQEMQHKVHSTEQQLRNTEHQLKTIESQSQLWREQQQQVQAQLQAQQMQTQQLHIQLATQAAHHSPPATSHSTSDNTASFDKLAQILERLEQRVQQPQPVVVQQPIIRTEEEPVTNLQRKILKKVQRNSKEYVKSILLSTITRYQQINGLQLKEMIVDEQGLVAKSSLYRLLNELEEESRISVSQDGKEKIYAINTDDKRAKHENQNI